MYNCELRVGAGSLLHSRESILTHSYLWIEHYAMQFEHFVVGGVGVYGWYASKALSSTDCGLRWSRHIIRFLRHLSRKFLKLVSTM